MTETNMATRQDNNPPSKRYDNVPYTVTTLNEQITELVRENETLDSGIETWEENIHHLRAEIRKAKRQKAKNVAEADKLRAKRHAVTEAAYRIAAIDQP